MSRHLSTLANRQTDRQTDKHGQKPKNQRMSEEWQWRRRISVKGQGVGSTSYMNSFEGLFSPLFCIFSTGIRYHRRPFIITSSEIWGSYPILGGRGLGLTTEPRLTLKFIKLCRKVWVLRDNTVLPFTYLN